MTGSRNSECPWISTVCERREKWHIISRNATTEINIIIMWKVPQHYCWYIILSKPHPKSSKRYYVNYVDFSSNIFPSQKTEGKLTTENKPRENFTWKSLLSDKVKPCTCRHIYNFAIKLAPKQLPVKKEPCNIMINIWYSIKYSLFLQTTVSLNNKWWFLTQKEEDWLPKGGRTQFSSAYA